LCYRTARSTVSVGGKRPPVASAPANQTLLFWRRDRRFCRSVRRRLHPGRTLTLGTFRRGSACAGVDWPSPTLGLQLTFVFGRRAPGWRIDIPLCSGLRRR
jgi:hypothetical protein